MFAFLYNCTLYGVLFTIFKIFFYYNLQYKWVLLSYYYLLWSTLMYKIIL